VRIGDPAPTDELIDARGEPTTLAALRGEATLLVFLRHLG
jgi:peroxiredoxin